MPPLFIWIQVGARKQSSYCLPGTFTRKAAYEDLNHEYEAVTDLLEKMNLTEKVKDASPNDWNSEQVKQPK
ncbi:hypothetical protein ME801_02310 [Lactobacillus delbrueckii]|nr:hypothetical protein ME801_02310 [Lactobacillus delbrueckii]